MLYIFDKDDTLIGAVNSRPANTITEQKLLPGVAEKCAELIAQGHELAVASNQGGVAWGFITEDEADELVGYVAEMIKAAYWAICPHHPKGRNEYAIECDCRKPKPGMLQEIMTALEYHPDNTIFVGDRDSDQQAAEAAEVAFIWAEEFFK